MLYSILETSDVPYGKEPTVVAFVRGLNTVNPIVDELFTRYTDRYFEAVEADDVEVEGLPFATVYKLESPFCF